ncbi:Multidrug resistance protein MexB [Gemmata obscuriglobus]|uniref:AcrB/AcrD/AcrF family protein n=1 Tax=Gemmata obscuriglobus TaxID=114 RepID=A0A2Z3GX96_9BACT|nr:efflux RND transporter permease subunit [Gemmata obscuriglobus]AWM36632.1 AcrB/AcrD/AcrF family protein [Gemmata obscuriglobus]QEG30732.1 Multidrug resistance protein MexB [Gemmata obscuriglobus]VTS10062.1 acriflavin resistance protein : Cation/multidrug efflux pump OS=Singulisphaera acidiphila (strain ATCC BAA-1392 / DSM 18658 / VKM B-2454 / MOB10) GN=Sinac_3839 PE=4 SV=1: ACR_tran: ACR_tran [Gemmata obscuriglobus UQM 2246]
MTASQFFVYKRPVAWSLLLVTIAWGLYSYSQMPQRQDPQIQIRSGVIITPYPGANPTDVEQQVTRKVEKKMTENPAVERVNSISRQGQSVVFVTLFDTTRNAEQVWQDLAAKLDALDDLPSVGGPPLRPKLDKDFGDTVAVMLTLSSPPVSDFEIDERARVIGGAVSAARAGRAGPRLSGVIVHPAGVSAEFVERMGRSLLRALTEGGVATDAQYVAALGAGVLDFQLAPGRTEAGARAAIEAWERDALGSGTGHPDVWPGVLVSDPARLGPALKERVRSVPGGVARYTFKQMREYADLIQDRLRQSKFVGRIDQLGTQDEAVFLYYSNRRLTELGLDPSAINARLAARNINLPGGQVELPGQTLAVKPSGEFKSEADLGGVPLDARPGYPLYLRDVVEVVRGYQDPPRQLHYRTIRGDEQPGPRRAVTLAVRHIKGTQIAEFDADVAAKLDALKAELPDDLRVERTSNEPLQVEKKIHQFADCLIEAVLIVVVVALVFMEWRSALLVAASIPLAVAMTIGLCHLVGIDIQQISIAALIIALGLLVDDPVVASDAINRELAEGRPRDVAAWLGPQKLARAILYATVTNIVAFLPLLLIGGGSGEFIYSLPVVVTASLVASRVVSMTFMPLLGYYLLRGQKGLAGAHPDERAGFAGLYTRVCRACIAHRWLTLFAATAALVTGVSLVPLIGSAFFPKDLHNTFTVNVFLPEGTSIRDAAAEAERVTRLVDAEAGDEVTAYTTFVGQGGPRFWLSVVPEQPAPNYAQILVHTRDAHATAALADRLKLVLPPHATGRLTVEVLESGPPIGVPVQIRVYGTDIAELRRLGAQVKGVMRSIPGTDNIHDDWDPDALQFGLRVRPDRAAVSGVTNEDVAAVTQAGLSGTAATYLRERDRLIPIALRLRPDERARTEDLANLTVFNSQSGSKVPLDQVSEFKLEAVPPKVLRRDNERCMTIKCDALPGTLPSAVVDEVEKKLKPVSAEWPPGYRFAVGGEKEEQEKGFKSIATAGLVSMLAIYLALVVQFNSLTKPLLVYAAVPFGMVGGLMGLLAFNVPLGFFAGLGLSSLMGVIVSHVIVLFEYIEEAHEKGEPVREAVVDAGLARLRPVLVTVLATVGGLIPLALKGGPLWEPLCYVQIIGLLVATGVTLLLVPVLYVVFVEDLGLVRWDATGTHADGPPPLDEHGLPKEPPHGPDPATNTHSEQPQ